MEGVHSDYWRAYFDVDSRIATLSVFALEDRGVTAEQNLAALRAFAGAVMTANAGEGAAGTQRVAEAPRGGAFEFDLFRRIFD
jgi:hypothetical protein